MWDLPHMIEAEAEAASGEGWQTTYVSVGHMKDMKEQVVQGRKEQVQPMTMKNVDNNWTALIGVVRTLGVNPGALDHEGYLWEQNHVMEGTGPTWMLLIGWTSPCGRWPLDT